MTIIANDVYGKELSNYLKVKAVDKNGNPILYEATGYGYDKYITGNDQIKLDSNKDSLIVYDSLGNFKAVLNLDGTKNDYLTNLHKEASVAGSSQLPGYPIPEPLPPLPGLPIPEQDKDAGKLVTPIVEKDKDDGKFITPIVERDKNEGVFAGPEINIGDWRDFILTNQDKSFVDYKGDLNKGDQIDLSKFTDRQKVSGGKANYVDPKTGWILSPDRAGANSHGGSAWTLTDKKGNRIATLDENGNVLRK